MSSDIRVSLNVDRKVLSWHLDDKGWVATLNCGHQPRHAMGSDFDNPRHNMLPITLICGECQRQARAAIDDALAKLEIS